MAEFISKLSSSATSWVYKSATGFENSTEFGTGSGDTHIFSGSLYVSGGQVVQNTGDTSWMPLPPIPFSTVMSADRFIVGENLFYAASGSLNLASTGFVDPSDPGISIDRRSNPPINITGKTYFKTNIYTF